MKNKLLLSSALISGLAFAGSALAETKITGSMDISLGSRSSDQNIRSSSGFGSETQLNISNSGTLNNGMTYAAGFSLESDDATDAFENAFININLAKGSMLHFGSDHFQSIHGTVTPKVSVAADTLAGSTGTIGSNGKGLLYVDGSSLDLNQHQGVGFLQNLSSFGKLGIYYTPNADIDGNDAGNDAVNFAETTNSGLGISFRGNLGVDGLTVLVGQDKVDATGAITDINNDRKSKALGVAYNFGQVAVGATRIKNEQADNFDHESDEFGVTFAVNNNLSLGATYVKTEDEAANTADEKIKMVNIGYNLGGASVSLNYAQVDNTAGGTNDDEFLNLRIGTKF
jgi:hypothetical protein